MSDQRTRTPIRGTSIVRETVGRPARDTIDEIRDLERDFLSIRERIDLRLSGVDERIGQVEVTAKAANSAAIAAAAVKPIPWARVVPIILVLLTGFAGVVGTVARTPSRELVDERADALDARLRSLASDLVGVQKELIATRATLESLRDLASRRLDALEQARARKGGK